MSLRDAHLLLIHFCYLLRLVTPLFYAFFPRGQGLLRALKILSCRHVLETEIVLIGILPVELAHLFREGASGIIRHIEQEIDILAAEKHGIGDIIVSYQGEVVINLVVYGELRDATANVHVFLAGEMQKKRIAHGGLSAQVGRCPARALTYIDLLGANGF